jgi:hypothetical protein
LDGEYSYKFLGITFKETVRPDRHESGKMANMYPYMFDLESFKQIQSSVPRRNLFFLLAAKLLFEEKFCQSAAQAVRQTLFSGPKTAL